MIFIVLLLYHIHLYTGITEAEDILTLPGSSVCNETILLDTTHHAAVIDFRVSTFTLDPKSHLCIFHVETTNTPYVGMKFLSNYIDNRHSNESRCSSELNIDGKKMQQTHFNSFPDVEISVNTYGYITVEIKLVNCTVHSNDTNIFELLAFKFGDVFCFSDEKRCVNSTRCVSEEMTCSKVYDFCNNDFLNCKTDSGSDNTYERYKRKGPPSIPGIVLGSVCFTVLVVFLLYVIACRKRPCFRKITDKMLCRSSLCHNLDERRGETVTGDIDATFTSETQSVSFNYTRFREPPPNYCDIQPNHFSQTGSAYPHFQNGVQNIPPPFYSAEQANGSESVEHELPPPYSIAVSGGDSLQYI